MRIGIFSLLAVCVASMALAMAAPSPDVAASAGSHSDEGMAYATPSDSAIARAARHGHLDQTALLSLSGNRPADGRYHQPMGLDQTGTAIPT